MKNVRWITLLARTLLPSLLWLGCAPLPAQTHTPLVLGTPRPDGNFGGVLLRRIYTELFRRLDVPIEIRTLPTARLALELASASIDADIARPWAFGDRQPELVRVDEPVLEINYALWATNPAYKLARLEQLRQTSYVVTYIRGVTGCEEALKNLLPDSRVVDITSTVSAIHMLHYGRNELHCGVDLAALSDAGSAEFAGKPPLLKVLGIAKPDPLYLYLQRKHSALAPHAASTLRKMKSDGTMERLRKETLKEFNLASGQ